MNIYIDMEGDGRSRYAKITKILKPIVGKTLHMNKIWRRIMIEIGASDKTIRECMNLMINLGMIHETDENMYMVDSCIADIQIVL